MDRIVARHTDDSLVSFGQVIKEQDEDQPEYIKLVAIDDRGLHIWRVSREALLPHTRPQHKGYSRSFYFNMSEPPEYLGVKTFIAKSSLDKLTWMRLEMAKTNRLKKLVGNLLA